MVLGRRLEHSLPQFTCMSVGDVVAISYLGRTYHFKVLETKPGPAISVIETDIEVDFAPPPGYVEPSVAKAAPVAVPATVAAKSGTAADGSPAAASASATLEREDSSKGFVAFSGQGQSIRGRASPSAPATVPVPRYVQCACAQMGFIETALGAHPTRRNAARHAYSQVHERAKCGRLAPERHLAAVGGHAVVFADRGRPAARDGQGQAEL